MNAPDAKKPLAEAVERAHAVLSASGAYRWLACPPSARFEEQFPDSESEFAKEGTWAHDLAEQKLLGILGQVEEAEYRRRLEESRASKYWSQANEEAVDAYVDYCMSRISAAREKNPDAVILVEQRLNFSHVVPEGFGTGDLCIICDGLLEVIDLKFGKGKPVSSVENPQAKLYGIGAIAELGFLFDLDRIALTIVQPRLPGDPSDWKTPVADLMTWAEEIKPIAQLAWEGKGEFKAGDHCDFCRGKGRCKARAEANLAEVAGEFADPNTLTDEQIAELLTVAKARRDWYGDLLESAEKEALAGKRFSGWKLVEGRSNRRYKDQDAVAKALLDEGIPEAVIYEPRSLLGITAMEKAITKKTFTRVLGDLVVKPAGKPTLVAASDPRPEIEPPNSTNGFEDF